MVSGRTCSITSNLQLEADPEHILKEHDDYKFTLDNENGGTVDDPNKSGDGAIEDPEAAPGLMQSVSDMLVHSAQSVKDFVSGNGSDTSESEHSEDKTLFQSMGEKIAQSAQSVKDAVNSGVENEDGEEKSLLQSVSDRIVQSARNVSDAVHGNDESLLTDADDTGEASILVHSVLD